MFQLNFFQDPRFGRDRIRLFKLLLVGLVLLAGAGILLFSPQNADRGNATKPAVLAQTGGTTSTKNLPPSDTVGGKSLPNTMPDGPEEKIDKAILAFSSGDVDGARKLLSEVDLQHHGSAAAWELAGLLKQADGDSKAAMNLYTQGLALSPSERLYYRRALLYRENGDLRHALEDLNKAAAHAPNDIMISNERLLLLVQIGRKDLADKELKALNARDAQSDPGGWIFALCGVALENGEYDKAGRLLGLGKKAVPAEVFEQMLKNPVISRQQTRPEILPYYIRNLPPQ